MHITYKIHAFKQRLGIFGLSNINWRLESYDRCIDYKKKKKTKIVGEFGACKPWNLVVMY
jgi:hypothetical protein